MAIFYSGNRVPLTLSLILSILMIFVLKDLRKQIIIAIVLFVAVFIINLNNDKRFYSYYESYYTNSQRVIDYFFNFNERVKQENKKIDQFNLDFKDKYKSNKDFLKQRKREININFGSGHLIIYLTGLDVFNDNIFFGGGVRSFSKNCLKKLSTPNRVCAPHPHNYTLQLFY